MGKIKILFWLVLSLILMALCYWIISQGYSWREMDWDGGGSTSLAEFFESIDIQTRQVERSGKICTEYFRLKDGIGVKTVCDQQRK